MDDEVEFPAHRKQGDSVTLWDVVSLVPDNELSWSILEYDGTGEIPIDLDYDALEEEIRSQPNGIVVSWQLAKRFAKSVRSLYDIDLIGTRSFEGVPEARVSGDLKSVCQVAIRCFDASYWTLYASDPELMNRFADFAKQVSESQ